MSRTLRSRQVALLVASLLVLALIAFVVGGWARSPERDVRCDKAKRAEATARGQDYACLLQIPGHDRGH